MPINLFKDPYVLDFVEIAGDAHERHLEKTLIDRIKDLLLELGGVLGQYRVPNLDAALNGAVGQPWRKAWNQARAKRRGWCPLSPIDWPL